MSDERSSRQSRAAQGWLDRFLARARPRAAGSVRDDLEDVLEHSAPTDEFSATERALLRNVLTLNEMRVADAMVPRADIIAIREDARIAELLSLFRSAGHSRLPVYAGSLDDPRGMVHIRDFLDYLASGSGSGADGSAPPSFASVDLNTPLTDTRLVRPVLYVPPSMPAVDLLARMQSSRIHMALVIDEYGGIDGLVSMEDVVELIVGDIEDEHDLDAGPMIGAVGNDAFDANARADLEETSVALGVQLIDDDIADEIDTLGGLVAHLAGRIPTTGECIAGPHDLVFEVLEADPRRLKRIRIHRGAGAAEKRAVAEAGLTAPPTDPSEQH